MRRAVLLSVAVLLLGGLLAVPVVVGHVSGTMTVAPRPTFNPLDLAPMQRQTVLSSRDALLRMGFSPSFMDSNVLLMGYEDAMDERVVRWLLVAGEYELPLVDRVRTELTGEERHSLVEQLRMVHDLTSTLSLDEAYRHLRSCLGTDVGSSIITYAAPSTEDAAALVMHGQGIGEDGAIVVVDLESGECR